MGVSPANSSATRDARPGTAAPRARARREWAHSLEQGPVPDEHVLGDGAELDVLAAAAEDLFARKG